MFDFCDKDWNSIYIKEFELYKKLDFKLYDLYELKRLLDKNNYTLERLVNELKLIDNSISKFKNG